MVKKVFILGRPGTGKSTVAQLLETIARKSPGDAQHIYDYRHLHGMFQKEIDDNIPEAKRAFCQKGPDACQGFDVIKFEVLDTVLEQMAGKIRAEEFNSSGDNKLLLIEFARQEYCRALNIFGHDILQDALLLYVRLDLENCIKRVQQRTIRNGSRSELDHFVSEDIMRSFYDGDDWLSKPFSEYLEYLRSDGVHVKVEELDNSGTSEELKHRVRKIFNSLQIHETGTPPVLESAIAL